MREAIALLMLFPWTPVSLQEADAPRELRIVAEIDGVDDLHLNATEARWVHREYSMPERVSINGREWDPRRRERWAVEASDAFLAPDVDLAGASVSLVRGRGTIAFRHDERGLVLSFDDSVAGGAGEYEVLVEFADELCGRRAVLGDPPRSDGRPPSELSIEATIDGRDELHLAPERADWLHLGWAWPTAVRVGGRAWDPEAGRLAAPPEGLFFPPDLELERVGLEVERGRGEVELEASAERLFLSFDDGAHVGADEYVVNLRFPEPAGEPEPRLPSGAALRVELAHQPATDVAGARLTVLALSPASGEYVPWPGLRGMDRDGRCVVALPAGTYRFEVLNRAGPRRLVALRTGAVRVTRAKTVSWRSAQTDALVWRNGEERLDLRELALYPILGGGAVSASGPGLELVVSPGQELTLGALGVTGNTHVAWWTRRRFGTDVRLDSSRQTWIRCDFEGHGGTLPADCVGTLHAPRSELSFPVEAETRLLTNRRFVGLSYRCSLEDGGSAVFRQRQVLLPSPGKRHTFRLGGEPTPRGSAAVLQNENLGSPEARELWWELVLVDGEGRVLDTQASDIGWRARASWRDGSPLPEAPLEDEALERLGDPTRTVLLSATYRWNGAREVTVDPAPHVLVENERYRSTVPGHLDLRARAYLDKARRTYGAIERVRGRRGTHTDPIEVRWWLNGGAVGVRGSITMPIGGMTDDDDWFSFPWALAHESLHGFGYLHGPELDRIDRAAMELFELEAWAAEADPDFRPPGW